MAFQVGAFQTNYQQVIAAQAQETFSGGYWPSYKKKRRFEIEQEAQEVIEKVVEAVAQPDTTNDDMELSLRLALQQNHILYRAIYLKIALDHLEQLRQHEAAMEEEAAIFLLMN